MTRSTTWSLESQFIENLVWLQLGCEVKTEVAFAEVADIGCGDNQFTKHLMKAVKEDGVLKSVAFHVHAYDISPNVYRMEDTTNVKVFN